MLRLPKSSLLRAENENRPAIVEQEQNQERWLLSSDIEKAVQEAPNMLQVQKDALIKKLRSLATAQTPDTAAENTIDESVIPEIEEILGKKQDNQAQSTRERIFDIYTLIEESEDMLTEVENTLDIDGRWQSEFSKRLETVLHAVEEFLRDPDPEMEPEITGEEVIVQAVILAITNSPTYTLTHREKQIIEFELHKIGRDVDSMKI